VRRHCLFTSTLRHPSPPRTPGSVRGGGFRPTINHQPHALKYSPAGPEISRKTSFNLGNPPPFKLCAFSSLSIHVLLGLGAHPNQPRTNNRNSVKVPLMPAPSSYQAQHQAAPTQPPRAVTAVTVSRLTTPRQTPRSRAASASAPSSAPAKSGDSIRKAPTPRVTMGLISSAVRRSLVVQKQMEAEERQLQGDLAAIFPQPHNSSYSKASNTSSSRLGASTSTFASEAARSIAIQSAANTSSRISKAAAPSTTSKSLLSPHHLVAASESTFVSDATADRVLRRVPNASMSLSHNASPSHASTASSQSSMHSSPSTVGSHENVQIPNTIADIGSADFCATINVGSTKGRLARALRIVQSLHNRVQQDGHVIKQLTREVQELRDTIKRRDEEVARVSSNPATNCHLPAVAQ